MTQATSGPRAENVIARLEKQLRDIWTAPPDSGSLPMSRVCTTNLVVVAGSRELSERYTPVVDEVTATIPARAIIVAVEPEAPTAKLDGDATAVCYLEGGRKVCSERILLHATGSATARVASGVEALLEPELATVLVWLGPVRADDRVFQDFARTANRLLLDSEYTSLSSLLDVVRWAREEPSGPRVGDLAWTRIAPWQELLARFFDDARTRPLAEGITRIRIGQACEPGARFGPEGALLLGWLATRLGWQTTHEQGVLQFVRPDGGAVAIALRAVPRPRVVAPKALANVEIETQRDGVTMHGAIDRDLGSGLEGATGDADVVTWRHVVSGSPPVEQHVRLGANKAAKWLERTLHRPAIDPAFDESVAFAEQIVEDGLRAS